VSACEKITRKKKIKAQREDTGETSFAKEKRKAQRKKLKSGFETCPYKAN
jgi:hypothetical protein